MKSRSITPWLVAALALPTLGCSDKTSPSRDTIEDTTSNVDTVQPDTVQPDTTQPDTVQPDTTQPDTTQPDTTQPDTTPTPTVVINEIAASGDPQDWIELFNYGTSPVALEGWQLTDDDPTHRFTFPAATTLAPGAWLLITKDPTQGGFDFGLGSSDSVFLYDAAGATIDSITWLAGDSPDLASFGRIPDGSGAFKTLGTPTPGAANVDNPENACGNSAIDPLEVCDGALLGDLTCQSFGWGGGDLTCQSDCKALITTACTARAAGLVVNEVESDGDDRIELFNNTDAAIDLSAYTLTDAGGGGFTFPNETSIAAGAYLVLTKGTDHTFGLGGDDSLELRDAGGALVDSVTWASNRAIPAYCRTPNGVGGFQTCNDKTFGNPNL